MITSLRELTLKNIPHVSVGKKYFLWDTNDGTNRVYSSVYITDPSFSHSQGETTENVYIYDLEGDLDSPVIPLDGYLSFGSSKHGDEYYQHIVRASILDWDVVVQADAPSGTKMNVLKVYGDVPIPGLDIFYDKHYIFPRGYFPSIDMLELLDLPFGISPVCYDIRTNTHFSFTDHSGYLKRCSIGIYRNNELFMELHGNPAYNIDKARTIIEELGSHPCDFTTIDYDKKIIGRKVWIYDQPGVITGYIKGQAAVIIAPDGIDSFEKPHWMQDEDEDLYMEEDIKTDIFDKNIWWFRN